ncbi:MAG TPA: hypothetical protein OIM45_03235 [Clostridiaceae bacterium]|nr:hypothetical protein [Clostridiaceae bacterium]
MHLKKCLFKLLCFSIIFMFVIYPSVIASENVYIWSNDYDITVPTSSSTTTEQDSNNSLSLESGSAILIEQESRSDSV